MSKTGTAAKCSGRCVLFKGRQHANHVNSLIDSWGYGTHNGPNVWKDHFPSAGGIRQSPVSIVTSQCEAVRTDDENTLTISYPTRVDKLTVLNTGRSCQVSLANPQAEKNKYVVHGGVLSTLGGADEYKYNLEQFHFHWSQPRPGSEPSDGSEHAVDSRRYDGELHIVHSRSSADKSNDIGSSNVVIGVFLQCVDDGTSDSGCNVLDDISASIDQIRYKDESCDVTVRSTSSLIHLLPRALLQRDNALISTDETNTLHVRDYWTYPGSLTMPPCHECVRWIMLKEPASITHKQMSMLRSLRNHMRGSGSGDGDEMIEMNCRHVQPLNGRIITSYYSD